MQKAMVLRTSRTFLSFSLLSSDKRYHPFLKFPKNPTVRVLPEFRPLCTAAPAPATTIEPPEQPKHSVLLERLRLRHIKESNKPNPETKIQESMGSVERESNAEEFDKKKKKAVTVVSFEELGLSEEVMGAVREMSIEVPTEIQCNGIPAVLDGKSVVLGSHTGSGKTLGYLLPLVQG